MRLLRQHLNILIIGCLIFISVHLVNSLVGGLLNQFGIVPRDESRWYHIFLGPWLHGNIAHLGNNLIGWVIFSSFVLLRSARLFFWSSFLIITVTGILVWFFARPAVHIGASGWVFGLWSLNIALALFDRRLLNILIAIIVVFLYGGMIYGILPQQPGVSFESHLFGAFAGVLAAWMSRFKVFRRKG